MAIFDLIPPYILGIMALCGTYCLILAYDRQYYIQDVLKNGVETTGTVVDIQLDPANSVGGAPVVDFTYPHGSYRHYSTTYRSPCPFQVGQQVQIWYKFYKSNQKVAMQHEEPGKLPLILLVVGIVLCLLSYPVAIQRMMMLF